MVLSNHFDREYWQKMDIYMINHTSRPDRLAFMTNRLRDLGLKFTRIEAIDGLSSADIGYPENHEHLSKPEFACYLSHVKCWEAFLETGRNYCLILEDDVKLSNSLPFVLEQLEFFEHAYGITKLEVPLSPTLAHKRPIRTAGKFSLHQVTAYPGGTGAYVISRDFAQHLISKYSEPTLPVDYIVYGRTTDSANKNKIMQLSPAIAIQLCISDDDKNSTVGFSDLHDQRAVRGAVIQPKTYNYQKLLRELLRPFRQVAQLTRLMASKLMYHEVSFDFDDK